MTQTVAFSFFRLLSCVLALTGALMSLPVAAALRYGEESLLPVFIVPAVSALALAVVFRFVPFKEKRVFSAADAVCAVGGIWVGVSLFGSIPLFFSGCFASFTDALFESVSGFTTTGASVVPDVESLPRCINLWRCQTHWLGGMGVIALAVAIVPLLGDGGFRLIKAESTGPEKEKITSFVASTAKSLWFIYVFFTVVEALLLHLAGIGIFDSVAHAFSTMGTGGFSTRNSSVGSFANGAAEWICTIFMLVASVNFALYYRMLTRRFSDVLRSTELRVFVFVAVVSFALAFVFSSSGGPSPRAIAFQLASIISTTGFMTEDYLLWSPAAQAVILSLFFIGGCSGSTAGGIKVVRWTLLVKQLSNDLRRIVHPYRVFTLRLDGASGREVFVPLAAGFIVCYLLLVLVTALFGAIAGLDPFTALTAAASMAGNIGPAFGSLGPTSNYAQLCAPLKWWYMFAMLAGRLEIYTILILSGRLLASLSGFVRRDPPRAHA